MTKSSKNTFLRQFLLTFLIFIEICYNNEKIKNFKTTEKRFDTILKYFQIDIKKNNKSSIIMSKNEFLIFVNVHVNNLGSLL